MSLLLSCRLIDANSSSTPPPGGLRPGLDPFFGQQGRGGGGRKRDPQGVLEAIIRHQTAPNSPAFAVAIVLRHLTAAGRGRSNLGARARDRAATRLGKKMGRKTAEAERRKGGKRQER